MQRQQQQQLGVMRKMIPWYCIILNILWGGIPTIHGWMTQSQTTITTTTTTTTRHYCPTTSFFGRLGFTSRVSTWSSYSSSSSSSLMMTTRMTMTTMPTSTLIQGIAMSGLNPNEQETLLEHVIRISQELENNNNNDDDNNQRMMMMEFIHSLPAIQDDAYPAITGRSMIVFLRSDNGEENGDNKEEELFQMLQETLYTSLSQMIDELLLYKEDEEEDDSSSSSNPMSIQQPLLLSIQPSITIRRMNDNDNTENNNNNNNNKLLQNDLEYLMKDLIRLEISQYELAEGMEPPTIQSSLLQTTTTPTTNESRSRIPPPTEQIEVDGAIVIDPFTGKEFWDTSSIYVWDGLLSKPLRQELLNVINNDDDNEDDKWDDVTFGPNPKRWIPGGLMDLPSTQQDFKEDEDEDEDEDDDNDNDNDNDEKTFTTSTTSTSNESSSSSSTTTICTGVGLSDEAIADLCEGDHPALMEVEGILSQLLPQFSICRMSEAVLGESVSSLTANAPCYGHTFSYHIDGDPNMTPPSPFTDIYGRYPNRLSGKPRFMSCIIYLMSSSQDNDDEEWNYIEWGAPTRFLDVATNTQYDIEPKPGRIVLMDQDVTHTVVPPLIGAGNRPRYSLVWKLLLHPRKHNQDMKQLHGTTTTTTTTTVGDCWPEPTLLGSALRS